MLDPSLRDVTGASPFQKSAHSPAGLQIPCLPGAPRPHRSRNWRSCFIDVKQCLFHSENVTSLTCGNQYQTPCSPRAGAIPELLER